MGKTVPMENPSIKKLCMTAIFIMQSRMEYHITLNFTE